MVSASKIFNNHFAKNQTGRECHSQEEAWASLPRLSTWRGRGIGPGVQSRPKGWGRDRQSQ